MLSPTEIFTLLFVTLGPLKLLAPFAQQTRELDVAQLRRVTFRVFFVGLSAVVVGAYVGSTMAARWRVSLPAILITAGVIFFKVAIDMVMSSYDTATAQAAPLPVATMPTALRLTFPMVVTPHGIAVAIALLAASTTVGALGIYAMLAVVMLVNLVAMIFIRQIMRGGVRLALQILGAVVGVLQVSLAIQILIRALRELHVLSA